MRLLSTFGLLLWTALATAADVADSQDLAVLPRFARAEIVDFSQSSGQERVFPAGSIRRISGQLRMEAQVASQGQLTALTYVLPAEHSSNEAFDAARASLQSQGAQLLFWCQGRDCGSSTLWANSVFANAQLNGGDDQQGYALLRLAAPLQDSLVALYGITRGNRRGYLHVEQLNASAALGELLPSPATLLRELKSSGELLQPDWSGEPTAQWVTLLVRSLQMDSTLRVSLNGAHAAAWQAALSAQGVRATRLQLGDSSAAGLSIKLLRE
jgi:hypothetical protein